MTTRPKLQFGQAFQWTILLAGFGAFGLDRLHLGGQWSAIVTIWALAINIIFFIAHVACTFVSYVCLPEVQNGLRGDRGGRSISFAVLSTTMACLFILFWCLQMWVLNSRSVAPLWLYASLTTGFFFHHDVAQKSGISAIYNGGGVDRRERKLFRWFLGLILADQLATGFPFFYSMDSLRLMPAGLPVTALTWFDRSACAAMVLIIVALFVRMPAAMPNDLRREKQMFLGRLLFYPLMPLSLFGPQVVQFLHGAEYFMITRTMFRNSAFSQSGLKLAVVAILCFGTLIGLSILNSVPFGTRDVLRPPSAGLAVATSLFYALIFLHYGMDRYIFRLRNESVRKHVAPLLGQAFANGVATK